MNYQRGEVVLVNYPFASGAGSKVRPAVIVQCDRNNTRLDHHRRANYLAHPARTV